MILNSFCKAQKRASPGVGVEHGGFEVDRKGQSHLSLHLATGPPMFLEVQALKTNRTLTKCIKREVTICSGFHT